MEDKSGIQYYPDLSASGFRMLALRASPVSGHFSMRGSSQHGYGAFGLNVHTLARRGRDRRWSEVPRNMPMLIPDRARTQLIYSDNVQIVGTSTAALLSYLFRCNSLFDPDQSGTGHQPYLFDQWAALYPSYLVIRSHAKITVYSGETNLNNLFDDLICFGIIHASQSSPANFSAFLENPQYVSDILPVGEFGRSITFNQHWDLVNEPGNPFTEYMEGLASGYSAAVAANPAVSPLFQVMHTPANGVANGQINFRIDIVFDAIFYAPPIPVSS